MANRLGTGQQQFLHLKYISQVRKKTPTNQFIHYSQTCLILDAVSSNMKGLVEEIDLMTDKNCMKKVEENRKRLEPINDTVILLVRLRLALTGYQDDSQFYPNVGKYSSGGVENVTEVLNYRVRGDVSILENHPRTCSKNASYISNTPRTN